MNNFDKTNVNYAPKPKPIRNDDGFAQQQITFDDTPLMFPPGMEQLFLLLYFISLPYIAGLLFLFFYVGEGKPELFLSLNEDSSFLLTWAIGYEILAALLLLYIVKLAFSFNSSNKPKRFRIP